MTTVRIDLIVGQDHSKLTTSILSRLEILSRRFEALILPYISYSNDIIRRIMAFENMKVLRGLC